jgi:polar amino acid transport system substrate-binding protein
MTRFRVLLALSLLLTGSMLRAQDRAAIRELAPAGKLRVGIGVGPIASAFWATRDPATGRPRGVTVDIGSELAKELGVPVEWIVYANSGELAEAAGGGWDVAFMPMDAEREKLVNFGPAYYIFESTFLVPPGSSIRALVDVDRPGVRVVGIANTSTARSAGKFLPHTAVTSVRTIEEIEEMLRQGKTDAVALGRESLASLAGKFPGARILEGSFQTTGVAVAVPKGHAGALAFASAFLQRAKTSGIVRRALDRAGIEGPVAPH